MIEVLGIIIAALLLAIVALLVSLLRRDPKADFSPLQSRLDILTNSLERTDRAVREEIGRNRDESANHARDLRAEVQNSLKTVNDSTINALGEITKAQLTQFETFGSQLKHLVDSNDQKLNELKTAVEAKLTQIQTDNATKLEAIRKTVDEQLQDTLQKRLGESFKQVSERLEKVHQGLGEMQQLAADVGGLQRVLTNVKERGTWGEYQLGAILEQILTPDEYGRNVHVQEGGETVEFAIKLPGKGEDRDKPVWIPIDSKFPKEDYERLVAAATAADAKGVEQATAALLGQVSNMAKDIQKKYIAPPYTTNFGILFLPTEGLYAEVLRQPGFHDEMQQKYKVLVAGPTTLSAILSSLRVGFQTLVIEKRAHEVWTVLGAVKTEFGRFGGVLDKVKRQLDAATKSIDDTGVRTRAMERTLRKVEQLPVDKSVAVLDLTTLVSPAEAEEDDTEKNT